MFDILWPIMGSMARHGLTAFAGYMVAVGLLPAAQANAFVAACMLFVGLGWSAWHKINTPEGLARLSMRLKDRNVKAAWAGDLLKVSPNVIAVFGICGVILAALASSAGAQTRVEQRRGGPKIIHVLPEEPMKAGLSSLLPIQLVPQGPDQLWANLDKLTLADLQNAVGNANAVDPPTAASKARVACYSQLVALISRHSSAAAAQAGTAVGSGVFTKFEAMAQLADALQSGSPMQVACAPVAQAMRLQLGQFISTVLGGGLSLAKLGVLP